MVYDVTDRNSFTCVDNWMSEVEKFASESAIKLFVGNKVDCDEKRKVSYEEGKELATKYGVNFIEASAKSSKNVVEVFQTLAKQIKTHVLPKKDLGTKHPTPGAGPKKLSAAKGKKVNGKSSCC